jgi:epoxyqueuosine reductase
MPPTLSQNIKTEAYAMGFSKVGIASSEVLTEEGAHLFEWLQRNFQASMHWMERNQEKRIDPKQLLPGVKSILCVALNYYTSVQHEQDPSIGKISRYAWGDDYHVVMKERLEKLFDYIQLVIPGVKGMIYVDTGPVMDKVWATRAGIGWMGKHTNIISREFGSWLFLGEILLDVELEYDTSSVDHCGACTACIDACPTKAIVQPYVVDSNKCISYLTIEHRGEFPTNISKNFSNWIYGCDICQEVCPWNRIQKETTVAAFQPRVENVAPNVADLVTMNQKEFSKRFYNSAVKRAKLSGLTRNAKAVLESQPTSK